MYIYIYTCVCYPSNGEPNGNSMEKYLYGAWVVFHKLILQFFLMSKRTSFWYMIAAYKDNVTLLD